MYACDIYIYTQIDTHSSKHIYIYIYIIYIYMHMCIRFIYIYTYASDYVTLHHITLHYITSHYVTLHYITLHYITSHYITLHYISLHYITLHTVLSREFSLKLTPCRCLIVLVGAYNPEVKAASWKTFLASPQLFCFFKGSGSSTHRNVPYHL